MVSCRGALRGGHGRPHAKGAGTQTATLLIKPHRFSAANLQVSEINVCGWNTDPNQNMPQLNSKMQPQVGSEGRNGGHRPTSHLQLGVIWDQLSTWLKESSEPQCKSHKPACWREKTPSTPLTLWLYSSPHRLSPGVSPGILTLWWGFGSCCDNLTLHVQMPKSWPWPWVTPIAFA